jgi:hypothetical protein
VATARRAFASPGKPPAHSRRNASRSSYSASPVVRPDYPIRTAYQGPLWNLAHSTRIAAS